MLHEAHRKPSDGMRFHPTVANGMPFQFRCFSRDFLEAGSRRAVSAAQKASASDEKTGVS
jgi:hypothetical protein